MANALMEETRTGSESQYGPEKNGPNRKVGEWRNEKAVGCYRQISVSQFVLAWQAFRQGHIDARALRTYFAAHELSERRTAYLAARRFRKEGERKDWKPEFTWEEVHALTGGGGGARAVRSSLRKLEAVGLLRARKSTMHFASSPDELNVEDLEPFFEMFMAIKNRKRRIHVPRRLLRELAAGFSRGVTATIIAHLTNCVYFHRSENAYRIDGRVKASWVAKIFGVSERAVVSARHKLKELGFLTIAGNENQKLLNRYGLRVVINIDWRRGESVENVIADPKPDYEHQIADPIDNRTLSKEKLNNSTPAKPGPSQAGVSKKLGGGEQEEPKLSNIVQADFTEVCRQKKLHTEAIKRGLAGDGERGFLEFAALLERARAHGKNPCALAAHLVWNKRYEYVTLADEDAARARIKEQLYGVSAKREEEPDRRPKRKVRVELSDDARFVKACQLVTKQKKLNSTPYMLALRTHKWSRKRWDIAEAELIESQTQKILTGCSDMERFSDF